MLVGCWPDRKRRLFVFGPREQDMTDSLRNRAIARTGRGVPLKPDGADALDVTRRAVAVLRGGDALVVAGEGHLSDHEGELMPLETGVAHFAMLAKVPVVPLAIIGTRWVHFGSTIRLTFGPPVDYRGHGSGREGARVMTAELQTALQSLLAGSPTSPVRDASAPFSRSSSTTARGRTPSSRRTTRAPPRRRPDAPTPQAADQSAVAPMARSRSRVTSSHRAPATPAA